MSEVVVAGALLVDGDRLLFGLRAAWKPVWPNCWDAIGGRVEAGESPEQAMVREVHEEIGVIPTQFDKLATGHDTTYGHAYHIYRVTAWTGGPPTNVSDEHTQICWFSLAELETLTNLAGARYPELCRQALVRHAEAPIRGI